MNHFANDVEGRQLGRGAGLYRAFRSVAVEGCRYWSRWMFDSPLVLSEATNQRLHRLQQAMHKSVRYFVEHYEALADLMPVSDRVRAILRLCAGRPYRPGTYRTDFLITPAGEVRLIEITCRQALNGFFTSGFAVLLAERALADRPGVRKIDDYTPLYDHLMDYFGEFDHVCILLGAERRVETKYSIPIFERAGYPVHLLPIADLDSHFESLAGAAVIGEFSLEELSSLPAATLGRIINSNLLNDLRTVFLIHDKRFFSVLGNEEFLRAALDPAEASEFKQHLVPTYTGQERPELWAAARAHKDDWIVKPSTLGKGAGVLAGCLASEEEWERVFGSGRIAEMVLQPFVPTRRFEGSVGPRTYCDYVVGTLLFFDDRFFGPGVFRASSHPVTSRGEERKLAPLVTPDTTFFRPGEVL